jgi:hypothetical protein
LIGVLLLGVGLAAGAAWTGWGRTPAAHAQGFGPGSRFIMGPVESIAVGREKSGLVLRFVRDRQAGDCYLMTIEEGRPISTMTKTDDEACAGF